jgi:TolA-binding protein
VREELKKLKLRVDALEQKATLEPSKVEVNASELFQKGKDQYQKQQYALASESFTAYLQLPKRKTSSKLLEEALFFKAESFHQLKKYKKAIVEYSHFSEVYSNSSHMPEVLYKIGFCFELLGMKEDARGFFQELIEKYPGSLHAKKVKKKVK